MPVNIVNAITPEVLAALSSSRGTIPANLVPPELYESIASAVGNIGRGIENLGRGISQAHVGRAWVEYMKDLEKENRALERERMAQEKELRLKELDTMKGIEEARIGVRREELKSGEKTDAIKAALEYTLGMRRIEAEAQSEFYQYMTEMKKAEMAGNIGLQQEKMRAALDALGRVTDARLATENAILKMKSSLTPAQIEADNAKRQQRLAARDEILGNLRQTYLGQNSWKVWDEIQSKITGHWGLTNEEKAAKGLVGFLERLYGEIKDQARDESVAKAVMDSFLNGLQSKAELKEVPGRYWNSTPAKDFYGDVIRRVRGNLGIEPGTAAKFNVVNTTGGTAILEDLAKTAEESRRRTSEIINGFAEEAAKAINLQDNYQAVKTGADFLKEYQEMQKEFSSVGMSPPLDLQKVAQAVRRAFDTGDTGELMKTLNEARANVAESFEGIPGAAPTGKAPAGPTTRPASVPTTRPASALTGPLGGLPSLPITPSGGTIPTPMAPRIVTGPSLEEIRPRVLGLPPPTTQPLEVIPGYTGALRIEPPPMIIPDEWLFNKQGGW